MHAADAKSQPDPAEQFVRDLQDRAEASGDAILKELIRAFKTEGLFARFLEKDASANRFQRRHSRAVAWSVILATGALLLAIAQLRYQTCSWTEEPATWIIEIGCVAAAAIIVIIDIALSWRDDWFVSRYQAEQYRLVIFKLVTDPGLWSGVKPAGGNWHGWIEPLVSPIAGLTSQGVEGEAVEEQPPRLLEKGACEGIRPQAVDSLLKFYIPTRLETQIDYFRKKTTTRLRDHRIWQPLVFALSVFFVAVHTAFEYKHARTESLLFLLLAALTPAAWAGFRTWRGSQEGARNALRAAAKHHILCEYAKDLERGHERALPDAAAARSSPDPTYVFQRLYLCETQLESEQGEWLRLMIEAEWF